MMNVFIWQRVMDVTDSWHSDGGVVAVAPTLERAIELVTEHVQKERAVTKDFKESIQTPDATVKAARGTEEGVWIFPDAGCC